MIHQIMVVIDILTDVRQRCLCETSTLINKTNRQQFRTKHHHEPIHHRSFSTVQQIKKQIFVNNSKSRQHEIDVCDATSRHVRPKQVLPIRSCNIGVIYLMLEIDLASATKNIGFHNGTWQIYVPRDFANSELATNHENKALLQSEGLPPPLK